VADSQPKTERPKPEPKALTPEYHKARKQLMLWAAILFIWELVGIDLEKAQETGGNAGALIKSIKSPQAVPWVLLILVAYFLFKTTVEWHQCSVARRNLRVSIIDFSSAWIVSLLAYALYIGQTISRVQIANVLKLASGWSSLLGVMGISAPIIAGGIYFAIGGPKEWREDRERLSWSVVFILGAFPALIVIALALLGIVIPWIRPNWTSMLIGAAIAIPIDLVLVIAFWLRIRYTEMRSQ